MATESTDGTELSVTLPDGLEEWLRERAEANDIDRQELLVQLLRAHRETTAFLEDETSVPLAELLSEDALESRITATLDERLDGNHRELERQLNTLDAKLDDRIDDVRKRVLQLRDVVNEHAPDDHDHQEFSELRTLARRTDSLADTVEETKAVNETLANDVKTLEPRVDELENKIDRLARVVVSLRKELHGDENPRERTLSALKRSANLHGVEKAKCSECAETVRIGLLTEPSCPHCNVELRELEHVGSLLRRTRITSVETPALESGDNE